MKTSLIYILAALVASTSAEIVAGQSPSFYYFVDQNSLSLNHVYSTVLFPWMLSKQTRVRDPVFSRQANHARHPRTQQQPRHPIHPRLPRRPRRIPMTQHRTRHRLRIHTIMILPLVPTKGRQTPTCHSCPRLMAIFRHTTPIDSLQCENRFSQ